MNTGEKVINWLYTEQLKVDAEWSIRARAGFTWWADKNSQRIEVIGDEKSEAGERAYLVSVRTEFLYNLKLNRKTLAGINALLMAHASMSGPVYDQNTGTLWLCSLVKVHEGIRERL